VGIQLLSMLRIVLRGANLTDEIQDTLNVGIDLENLDSE